MSEVGGDGAAVDCRVADGVCQVRREGTRWLATGHDGGYRSADAAYNCTVPEGFERTDLAAYVAERRERAGFGRDGPALLTGVEQQHARRADLDGVTVVATAGVSNPAALPVTGDGERTDSSREATGEDGAGAPWRPGTVNLLVCTDRALTDGALASLLGTAVEAKTATLRATTGFTGTTSDAVVVGADTAGRRAGGDGGPAAFAGSATALGRAARVCVRDAVLAGLDSRYGDGDATLPESVADAEYGAVTEGSAVVSRPGES